jgi:pyridoxamine 5'-phosphate oxidase
VLLKGLDEQGFTFFTNYESAKGRQIDQQPHAALVFFWKELERQVRIEGTIERLLPEESDAYFSSRPAGSRIGAWASPQSTVIADRRILEERVRHFEMLYNGGDIPRPTFWGGYRVVPSSVEFWQGRSSRLHDRIVFSREAAGNKWDRVRLAP